MRIADEAKSDFRFISVEREATAMAKIAKPTAAELEILQVLWEYGPSTVRAVQQELSQKRVVGYTTVLKLMQIMTEKGLVIRDESSRSHVYRAKRKKEQTQRQLIVELLASAFGGSAEKLVMQALRAKRIAPEELAEIRRVIDELDQHS